MSEFKWRHFEGEIILWAVRWYCRYGISYRDLEQMMGERGVPVDHSTIYRWVQKYAPEIEKRLRWQWRRPQSTSWRVDETYVKVRGKWTYLYRALDKDGNTIDFYLSPTRNAKAAKRFLSKALNGLKDWEKPTVINTDKAPTYGIAISELKAEGKCPEGTVHRQVKYLNNVVEADHGKLKQLIRPVRGFKTMKTAYATIMGFEVMRALRKGQAAIFNLTQDIRGEARIVERAFGIGASALAEAVVDERTLMRDALRRGMGETTFAHVKAEFDARQSQGDFRQLKGEKHATGRSFTTPETIANERANVRHVMRGQNTVEPIMNPEQAAAQAATRKFLNEAQRGVITDVLTSRDRIHGVQGLAGTGKTTVLASIREGAEKRGYKVEGFAPTSRAAGQLREEGIEATTLQNFLARGQNHPNANTASPHLYMLDESSLASTRQMRAFLDKIKPEDRVLVIGDTAQHQGVDAGRPFEQMQDAGMRTSQLDQIVRQRKNPALLEAVQHLAKGETAKGIEMLAQHGRITQIAYANERIQAIAKDYAANPERTIIVSPDNRSRQLINQAVRVELQETGRLGAEQKIFSVLAHRSDMTGADREWAARYKRGDILIYEKGSKAHGIARSSTAVVLSADARNNTITVQQDGGKAITYDPKRLKGVNAYRETQKEFATGDRIQFTAKDKELGVNNRDLGTITRLETGQITVRMDGKTERAVHFDPAKMRHVDHGYAVTSHVSQGLTEGRVIANIDTDSARSLINTRLAYVAVSRAEHDARIYTNDAEGLRARLATNISKSSAVDFRRSPNPATQKNTVVQVRQYADPNHRMAAVALAYAEHPSNSVVIAKDPAERRELNQTYPGRPASVGDRCTR